jgi:hypothetical protein
MAEQKLNLLKLPAGCVIQPSTCAAKVVRSNTFETAFRTPGLHHAPDNLGTESIVPNSLGLIDGAKYRTRRDSGGGHPVGQSRFNPGWHWNRPHMAALPDHIGNHPMLFSLLNCLDGQTGYLCPAKTAS